MWLPLLQQVYLLLYACIYKLLFHCVGTTSTRVITTISGKLMAFGVTFRVVLHAIIFAWHMKQAKSLLQRLHYSFSTLYSLQKNSLLPTLCSLTPALKPGQWVIRVSSSDPVSTLTHPTPGKHSYF